MKEKQPLSHLNGRTGGLYYTFTIGLYVIVTFLGQAIMGAIAHKESSAYLAVCSTFSGISFLAVIVYAVFFAKVSPKKVVGESFGVKYLPLAILLAGGMFLGLGFVNESIARVLGGWGLNVSPVIVPLRTPWHLVVFSITFALLPAIAEELFFRGIILNSLSGTKKVYAVLVTALCFSLYHCSLTQLVYQFIYGVALGFLYLTAKSILPCIIAHFINNFAVLCFEYFRVKIDLYSTWIVFAGAVCLAIFSAIVFLVLLSRKKNGQTKQTKKGEVKSFLVPYTVFAFLVCIALAVGALLG